MPNHEEMSSPLPPSTPAYDMTRLPSDHAIAEAILHHLTVRREARRIAEELARPDRS